MKAIEVKNLSKEYKYKVKDENKGFFYNLFHEKEKFVKAVNNISFDVEEGETVAFIGPNGAGKSTTIKMLTGIIYPTKGDIKICGLLDTFLILQFLPYQHTWHQRIRFLNG